MRSAAGVAEERLPPGSLAETLEQVLAAHDSRFAQVLAVCSVLVDETPLGRRDPADVELAPGAVVDLLPPFAGG